MDASEFNFDGLVGPTHCYAGLSYGNIASMSHRSQIANPREAALQGLDKAYTLFKMGFSQGLIAPQERPYLPALRQIGFSGSDAEILKRASLEAPELLAASASSSSMWTANAATVSPSADSADGKVHFTSANLNEKFHRSIEAPTTSRLLQAMFPGEHFAHHKALPATPTFGDEGAANHTRFCEHYGQKGLQLFVYGRVALDEGRGLRPQLFPARQTREASEAVARQHLLVADDVCFAQQNPAVIDAGAFHNDVVAVGNQNVLLYHEQAFHNSEEVLNQLRTKFARRSQKPLIDVAVPTAEVSLKDAVSSYLFNSQLITRADGQMILIAPLEVKENPAVHQYLSKLIDSRRSPIAEVRHFDVKQSMRNGGGPACLRLRVVLTQAEQSAMNPRVLLTEGRYLEVKAWINKHYRDRLQAEDLADSKLLMESRVALDELTQMLNLGSVYGFQK